MSREEIQKLLGGYATNTLTPEEQQALFAAALEDQELFDALGREQPLRDLLRDPDARAHLLAALDQPAPAPWFGRWWKSLSAVAVAAALAGVTIVAIRLRPPNVPPVMDARVRPPVVPSGVPMPPPPAPAEPRSSRARPGMARPGKSPAASTQPTAPAPAPPPALALPAAPPVATTPTKDTASLDKAAAVVSAGAQMVEVQAQAGVVAAPPVTSTGRVQDVQNLPVTTRSAATPGVNAELKTGAAPSEAHALFYGAGSAGARGGGGGGGRGGTVGGLARPMAQAALAPAGHLGIQYRIRRETDSGEFVESGSAATGVVAAGALFKLQITANDGGYLRILQEAPDGAWREILNRAVGRMLPIETEPIEQDQPGRVKFYLTFSRQPLPSSSVAQPDDDIAVDRGSVVTVAARAADARQLSFNLTLTVQ